MKGHDIDYLDNKTMMRRKKYDENSINEYFSLSSVFEMIKAIIKENFGMKIKFETVKMNEIYTNDIKSLKKFIITEGEKSHVVYLELFSNERNVYVSNNTFIFKFDFKKTFPYLINHEKTKDFLGEFSKIIFKIKSKNDNKLKKLIFQELMELNSFEPNYLTRLRHFEYGTNLPKECIQDLKVNLQKERLSNLRLVFTSLLEFEIFGNYSKNLDISIDNLNKLILLQYSKFDLFIEPGHLKNIDGQFYLLALSKIYAYQIYFSGKPSSSYFDNLFDFGDSLNLKLDPKYFIHFLNNK
jgi:hypothetical protein